MCGFLAGAPLVFRRGEIAMTDQPLRSASLQALLEKVEVLGPNQLWLHPSAEAQAPGLGPLSTGEFRTKVRQSGRGERI